MEQRTRFFDRPAVYLILLAAVYVLGVNFKAVQFNAEDIKSVYNPVYQSENAVHYRHAQMVSRGEKVPALDRDLQYPDGYEVFKRSEVFEEYTAGFLHRVFFRSVPFHRFVEYFDWWWSSLSVVGVFLLALMLTRSGFLALLSALFYAVSAAAVLRTTNGMFLREIFTLPLMFLHMALMMHAMRTEKLWPSLAAGPLAFVIMGSWQISQFYYLIVALFPVLKYLFAKDRQPLRRPLLRFFILQAVFLTLAGLTVPYLRTLGFLGFWGLGLTYAFIVLLVLDRFLALPVWARPLLLAGLTLGFHFLVPARTEMNWVFQTALLKLRHFLQKPDDPNLLPLAVRSIWAGPFRSPPLFNIVYILTTYWFWAFAGGFILVRRFLKGRTGLLEEFTLYLLLAFFAVYVLFDRLSVFFIVPVVLCIPVVLTSVSRERKLARALLVLAAIGSLGLESFKTWTSSMDKAFFGSSLSELNEKSNISEYGIRMDQAIGVFEWLNRHTDKADPVFTRYAMSPALLLYTGHPVFLTPIFDPVFLRKMETFETGWFKPEADFNRLAFSNNIRYVVYYPDVYLGNNAYSLRYQIGLKRPSTNEVAYLFHFHPERLKDFQLVYQNSLLRVYKRKDARLTVPAGPVKYSPLFDEKTFKEMSVTGDEFLDRWNRAFNMKRLVDNLLRERNFGPAQAGLMEILGLFPRYPEALNAMGRLSFAQRDYPGGLNYLNKSMAITPNAEAQYGLVMVSSRNMTQQQLLAAFEEIRRMDPVFFPAYLDLIGIYRQTRRYDAAARICKEMLDNYPAYQAGYKMLKDIYLESGRPDLADQVVQPR